MRTMVFDVVAEDAASLEPVRDHLRRADAEWSMRELPNAWEVTVLLPDAVTRDEARALRRRSRNQRAAEYFGCRALRLVCERAGPLAVARAECGGRSSRFS